MIGWGVHLRFVALVVPVALSACAGLTSIDSPSCSAGSSDWDCVRSFPAFGKLSHNNNPHTPHLPDTVAADYDNRHLSIVAADRKRRIETANGIGAGTTYVYDGLNGDDRKRYGRIKKSAEVGGGQLANSSGGTNGMTKRHYDRRWRVARQIIYLGGKPAEGSGKVFRYSAIQASTTEVSFRSIWAEPLKVTGHCDGPVDHRRHGGNRTFGTGEAFSFIVPAENRDRLANRISPSKQAGKCEIDVSGSGGYRDRITLVRDDNRLGIDGRYDVCFAPQPENLSRLEQVFYAGRWLSQTCVMKRQKPRLLADARDGFNAKIEMLLGRRLTNAFFDAGDPKAQLDFSRAPHLDIVYVSYLDIKADFTGKILERLLRHHAARGTRIRVIVTEILEREKDRALFEAIAADYPNVELQEFRWRPARGSAYDERASGLYKTHHIKLLAALSRQKGASRMIIGGRNLHDGFLYKKPLDLSRYPELQNYEGTNGLSLNYYSNYSDFDIAIDDPETVRTVISQFSTVWNRDRETNVSPPFSIQTNGGKAALGARHFISVPYADGRALEKYYVELIDAAEHKIEIVNPYLNPTPAIAEAFERAVARGVEIVIVARVNLRGDIGGKLLTELNELFVEKFSGRITMYEYQEPDVVLHSKFFMIDEKLSVVSSTNFNHRSFLHDSENGMVFLDPAVYRRYKRVFETYRAGSTRLTPDVDIPPHYRLLLRSKLLLEAL